MAWSQVEIDKNNRKHTIPTPLYSFGGIGTGRKREKTALIVSTHSLKEVKDFRGWQGISKYK